MAKKSRMIVRGRALAAFEASQNARLRSFGQLCTQDENFCLRGLDVARFSVKIFLTRAKK
jgi:hypothetical protein